MPKLTPVGGHRGSTLVRSGSAAVFETGTDGAEWKVQKLEPLGPKGLKGVTVSSEMKTELPSGV